MKYLTSSFSLQMITGGNIEIKEIPIETLSGDGGIVSLHVTGYRRSPHGGGGSPDKYYLNGTNAVGHEGTARALSQLLGVNIPVERKEIKLAPGDILFVALPTGRRLDYGEEVAAPDLKFFRIIFHRCPGWQQVVAEVDTRNLLEELFDPRNGPQATLRRNETGDGIIIGRPGQETELFLT